MPIEPERGERRAQHRADEQHFAAILSLGEAEATIAAADREKIFVVGVREPSPGAGA